MKNTKILMILSLGFILISALSLLSVSIMAFSNPQSVMDLVSVTLNNNDAFSSIRGVYGGVGLTIFISLIYLAINDVGKGLIFLSILWGSYALSRIMTILMEGSLGNFGNQWLVTESILFLLAMILIFLTRTLTSGKLESNR